MRVCSRGRNIWDGRLESWTHIGNVGEELGLIDIELDPIETRRIVAGILNNLSDVDASMTPFDAGLGDFVDLDRDDDFFGQDALRMADRRTRRFGLGFTSGEPLIGAAVTRDGVDFGLSTAGSRSPHLECGIGYAGRASSASMSPSRPARTSTFRSRTPRRSSRAASRPRLSSEAVS